MQKIDDFIHEIAALCTPAQVIRYDGSEASYQKSLQTLVDHKSCQRLKEGCYYCRSSEDDVARVEEVTFICSNTPEDAGPTNHWKDPKEARQELQGLMRHSMQGRTMYVIPYCLGPVDSPYARFGIELTDSPYVVANMHIMTTTGDKALEKMTEKTPLVLGVHSVGHPLIAGQPDVPWPCNPTKRIMHFPETREIWSYGSGYGGNALLAKKCFGLRIASKMAQQEGWLAEHMLIMGVTSPTGKKRYVAAAFPSGCGKTNFAMMMPSLKGWKVECVGDDIAWLHVGKDGRLHAINPEQGFFGIAPGTSDHSNPVAMQMLKRDALFTNVALTEQRDVWWEGKTKAPPPNLIDWKGVLWDQKAPASHPNARFTVSKYQCPILDPLADAPQGVPIDAIIFGGRRATFTPLVLEANNWEQGVLWGAMLASERTAASVGEVGKLQRDPFAMRPFCGYNMGQYFQHWLDMQKRIKHLPRIYSVNWFRKDEKGEFLWPGFGDNIRVLEWIFDRLDKKATGHKVSGGILPQEINVKELQNISLDTLLHWDEEGWKQELADFAQYAEMFGDQFPKALRHQMRQQNTPS